MRVTVAGALPRTDLGTHPVAEDTVDGHDTAMKGAVTDGMKRAFRGFGVQFGNGFYGGQPQATRSPVPERVPANARNKPGPTVTDSRDRILRKRLFEIAAEQGFDENGVRNAVVDRMGKSVEDLTASELEPLVEAAGNKLRQMREAQNLPRT